MIKYSIKNLRKSINCECSKKFFSEKLFYKKPPKCEIDFGLSKEYKRSYFYCSSCNHWFSDLKKIKLGDLYSGNFNQSIYKNKLFNNFIKIINLPKKKSDNFQRAARINEFCKNYFKEDIKNINMLDIGSGTGVFPYVMKKLGYRCSSIDPDLSSVNHIRKNIKIKTFHGDFLNINSKIGKYDLITFNKVLEHVVKPDLLLKHALKFLKNRNSIVYIELPDGEQAMLTKEGKNKQEFTIDHLHVFSIQSAEKILKKSNYISIQSFRYVEPSGKVTFCIFSKPIDKIN